MKKLADFIAEGYLREPRLYEAPRYLFPNDTACTFDNFLEVNGIDEPSPEICEWFAENVCAVDSPCYKRYDGARSVSEYITEMLRTATVDRLKRELNIGLPGDKSQPIVQGYGSGIVFYIPESRYYPKEIGDICDRMMWVFTAVEGLNGRPQNPELDVEPKFFNNAKRGYRYAAITVEPVQAELANEYVYNECGGAVYHLTTPEAAKDILKSGLRVRGSKNSYRYINNRTYFFCAPRQNLDAAFSKVLQSKGYRDYRVLRVDVGGYNVDFYKDPLYPDCCVYSYVYFPPQKICDATRDFWRGQLL